MSFSVAKHLDLYRKQWTCITRSTESKAALSGATPLRPSDIAMKWVVMASFTYELRRRESNIKDHTLTGLIMSAESINLSLNLSVVFYNIANEGQSNILAQGLQVVQVFYTTCVAQICPISLWSEHQVPEPLCLQRVTMTISTILLQVRLPLCCRCYLQRPRLYPHCLARWPQYWFSG